MANHDDAAEHQLLTAWAQRAAETLELEPLDDHDVSSVLAAATAASAGLVRSAGPVAMYLAGLLLATGHASDVDGACRMAGRYLGIRELAAHGLKHPPQDIAD